MFFKDILGCIRNIFYIGLHKIVAIKNDNGEALYKDFSGTYRTFDMTRNGVEQGRQLRVPENYHMIAQKGFEVDGDLIVDGDFCEV